MSNHTGLTILEPDCHGHRLRYVKTLADEAVRAGIPVRVILDTRARRCDEYVENLSGSEESLPIQFVDRLERCLRHVADEALLAGKNEYVVILDADRHLRSFLDGRQRPRLSLLLMRSGLQGKLGALRFVLKLVLVLHLRYWSRSRVARLSGRRDGRDGNMVLRTLLPYVTDPPPVRAISDEQILRGIDRPYVLVAGAIDQRKSVMQLASWAVKSRLDVPPSLVLAGRVSPEIREQLASIAAEGPHGRVVVIDKYLTDSEMQALYLGAKATMCLYENNGPAGAVAYSREFAKPVVGWGSEQLLTQAAEAGLLVPCLDRTVASIDTAVSKLADMRTLAADSQVASQSGLLDTLVPRWRLS